MAIPSAAWDMVCTYHAVMVGGPFIQTDQRYNKIFALSDGHLTLATNLAKLKHKVREPARTVNMVRALENQYLLSRVKFAEADHVSLCDIDEVNIYDGQTATITLAEEAVLKGWRCLRTKLWRITIRA